MKDKIICVDIDGVLTTQNEVPDFKNKTFKELEEWFSCCKPNRIVIKKIANLGKENYILIHTSRNDFFKKCTINWLKKNKIKYNDIIFGKPYYNFVIDDKSTLIEGVDYYEI